MAKKRHHMTKKQFKAYQKHHGSANSARDFESEQMHGGRAGSDKSWKKNEQQLRRLMHTIQGHSGEVMEQYE